MKHKVKIAVSNGGTKTQVLTSGSIRLPMRLLRWLLGDFCEILVLTPGKSVQGVEIQEVVEEVDFSG
ncbi:hypothetical protein [Ruminococcus sp. XPD3002]|uniref:hypothetical protein n=1 Tax=Ruminococcus sp. XPD3002 TaxID=1452269 RepID=UPI00091B110A|nr:hypothetical protein SAMN04487832_10858 [Ruminococcus flavefaciens]